MALAHYDFGEETFCVEVEVFFLCFVVLEGKGIGSFWRLCKFDYFLKVNEIYLERVGVWICLILKILCP